MNIGAASLLRALPEPHLLVSSRGEILATNPTAARLLALAEPAPGLSLSDLVVDQAESVRAFLGLCSGSTSPLPGVLWLRGPDGQPMRCRCKGAAVEPTASPAILLLRLEPEGGIAVGFHLLTQKLEELEREVRQRRCAEAELRETTARLDAVVRASPLAIIGLSPTCRVTVWNPAAERMFGWSEAEVTGAPLPIVPDEEREDFEERWAGARLGRAAVSLRARRRRKDGSLVDVSVSSAPLVGPDGATLGIIAVLEDVTDQLRREAELRESENRFRATFEQAAVGLAHVGLDGDWLRVNERLCEITGYSREDLLALTFQKITHPEDLESDLVRLRRLLAGEIESYALEKRYVRKDGGLVWVDLTVSLVRTATGEPAYFIAVVQDIGRRKRAEEDLQESETFSRRLVESSGDCIKVLDLQGRLLSMNPAGQQLMQIRDFGPLIGTDWLALWGEEQREAARRAVGTAREGGEGRFQGLCPTAAGEPRWWDVLITVIPDAEGRPFRLLSISRDITAQKAAEEEIRRAKEAAEAASRAKSQFLAIMSHELRTPLTGIIGYADLIASDVWGPISEHQRMQIARIKGIAWQLVSVIEEILTFSRMEAGKEEIRLAPVDLTGILRESVELLEPQAAAKGIELRVELPTAPLEIETDPGKLRQIVLNLVGNAVKFTDQGRVELSLELRDGSVLLRVRDTGPGIPADQQERIFQPFTQIDESLTRSKGGTGLGLTVCRSLGRLLGGDVAVEESTVGAGSTFVVRLPARVRTGPAPILREPVAD